MDDAIDSDTGLLAALERCNAPPRPNLEAAKTLLADCKNGREAWERLLAQGMLPASWLDDSSRYFVLSGYKPSTPPEPGVRTLQDPPTRSPTYLGPAPLLRPEVQLYAADLENILVVEALAREAVARLWPWTRYAVAAPTTICWTNQSNAHWNSLGFDKPGGGYTAALAARRVLELDARRYVDRRMGFENHEAVRELPPRKAMLRDGLAARDFRQASRAGKRVPRRIYGNDASDHPLARTLFADLPNPFEPCFEVWQRGYALGSITDHFIELHMAPLPKAARGASKKAP